MEFSPLQVGLNEADEHEPHPAVMALSVPTQFTHPRLFAMTKNNPRHPILVSLMDGLIRKDRSAQKPAYVTQ